MYLYSKMQLFDRIIFLIIEPIHQVLIGEEEIKVEA